MTRVDFNQAWEERPRRRTTSHAERETLADLAAEAGIETPNVFWSNDVPKVVARLTSAIREPSLGPM